MLDDKFFVTQEAQPRPVTLSDGSVHTVHFREPTAGQLRAYYLAEHSTDDEVRAGAQALLIAACVCEPDGKPGMTREKAATLKLEAATALMAEILALQSARSASAKKPSPPGATDGSGTS